MGRDDEDFDFEIAEIDQNGCFLKQIYCWWPGDDYQIKSNSIKESLLREKNLILGSQEGNTLIYMQ